MQNINLTNHFLIAMPAMADPNFSRAVAFIAEHGEDGAIGLIINRPIDLTVKDLFDRIEIPFDREEFAGQPVYFGGPVQTDRGFVLHRPVGDWQSSLRVGDGVALTSSKDVLVAMAEAGQPREVLISLGYSGWGAGQLEEEIAQNAWLTVPADPRIIFEVAPDARFDAAMQLLGIDFANLSDVAGHA